MTERVLNPEVEEDRIEVRQALVQYVNQLTSEQVVDLLLEMRRDEN